MKFDENPIWRKLEIFSIDPPDVSLTFTQRLARENSWSQQFASDVVLEYKKFLFLCASQDQPCTPPDAVDQAWHLHLAYTKSYWNDLCGNVLGKPLHHNPTEGGNAEQEKFTDYYDRTLSLYREVFQSDPPVDIWPPSNERFNEIHFARVDTSNNWVVRKRKWYLAGLAMVVFSFVALIANNIAFTVVGGLIGLALLSDSNRQGKPGSGCSGGGCGGGCSGHGGDGGDSGCSSGCSGCGGGCGGGD